MICVLEDPHPFDLRKIHQILIRSPLDFNFNTTLHNLSAKHYGINRKVDVGIFKGWIDNNLRIDLGFQSFSEVNDAVKDFTNLIHQAILIPSPSSFDGSRYCNNYVKLGLD